MPLISPFLVWISCTYWKFRTNQYLSKMCPQQKMSKIGRFRRNFTTFEQTMQFLNINFCYGLLHQGFFFSLIKGFSFEPQTNFHLANLCDYLYMDIYHGIFLPIMMEIPPTLGMNSRRPATDFFVRKPKFLEPRRPVQSEGENGLRRGSAALWRMEDSVQTKKRRNREKIRQCSTSTDLHQERRAIASGDKRVDTNTTEGKNMSPAETQIFPQSPAGGEQRRKSIEDILKGDKPTGEIHSLRRNLTGKLQNMDEKSETGTRRRIAAKLRSQTIEVQVHGSMSQGCDQINNSHFESTRSDPSVPIDI